MKLIIAIIRPERLEAVQVALSKQQMALMSVSQVLGYGREPGQKEIYRGTVIYRRPSKVRLELAVQDSLADEAVIAIVGASATNGSGRLGDGEIFVMQMDECVRICRSECEPVEAVTIAPIHCVRQDLKHGPGIMAAST